MTPTNFNHMTATPASVPMRLTRTTTGMTLANFSGIGRRPCGNMHSRRGLPPLTVLQQRQFAEKMKCRAPLFTASYVIELGAEAVARLLDTCYYDLIQAELKVRIVTEYVAVGHGPTP